MPVTLVFTHNIILKNEKQKRRIFNRTKVEKTSKKDVLFLWLYKRKFVFFVGGNNKNV